MHNDHVPIPYLVVGAGPAGCVVAERLAAAGCWVTIVEKRGHIAGNTYDEIDSDGILVHRYGPHAFHTNNATVWEYLSMFGPWNEYQHRVRALVDDCEVPVPVNLDTVNQVFGLNLTAEKMVDFLRQDGADSFSLPQNAEQMAVNRVGWQLYEKIFKHYSEKQWGCSPRELSPEVTARLPVRYDRDDRYFTDKYQGVPQHGYTRMFQLMLDHPRIEVLLNTDFQAIRRNIRWQQLIYSGPLDEFFDCCYGRLPYRSLRFEFETLPQEWRQSVGSINYPKNERFTRITEFKHFTGQRHSQTTICREYPQAEGEPYYPVPLAEETTMLALYQQEAENLANVHFVGRLAEYRYLNMDVAVAHAMQLAERLLGMRL
jgi:UDP-galactopyranose mutase